MWDLCLLLCRNTPMIRCKSNTFRDNPKIRSIKTCSKLTQDWRESALVVKYHSHYYKPSLKCRNWIESGPDIPVRAQTGPGSDRTRPGVIKALFVNIFVLQNYLSLLWRHNGRDGASNHQPHDYWLNLYSGKDQRKHQSAASLAFVRGIHRWPVNSPHKDPVTRKMFLVYDVIIVRIYHIHIWQSSPQLDIQ